ncbi:hypothetical protein MJM99_34265, partial [Salmonella enterica subsp. enterica serovar Kentucky]|nr:hypothetical protein [Salmonella enterica subsp. enterica serovar Kentucky]
MARKTKQQALETRQHILDVALRLFSQQGVTTENDFASFPPSSSNPFPLRYPYKIRVKQRQLNCFVTRDVR